MREMKDSGISWVGEIPKAWSVKKIKHISYVIGGNGFNVELQGLDSGDYPFCKASDISNAGKYLDKAANYVTFDIVRDQHYNIIPKGAILFPKIGEAMKKNNRTICVLDCCADNNCQAIVPFERNSGMFFYYILTCVNMGWFDNAGTIPCMNNRKFLNSKVPFPPLDEQQRIAEFLDRACGKIDGLKADIQAQIDTLEQYKRSVITEAVTHGLNPSAPMKDSGAGWMPLIPLHWKADKLKFHLRQRGIKNQIDKQVLSLYREYGIVPKDSRDDNHNVTSEDVSDYRYVRVGDFVVNKMKAWQGSVAVSNYEGIVSPAYFVYEFSDDLINKRYFHYLMRNKTYATEFRRLSGGIREGQWDLPSEALNNTIILLPPLDEQQEIADYLDNKCAEIEQIIADKKSQIETLDGYKKSLIYEYVTGKKEVE